ncbi:MAG: DUF3089 domain-containing protein [Phenylobacterium sp.]|uniref:DUF3089 domain-containing protein n=1 Tax=Phenylobacterium sp. TaxID=1871053 RepID=UPI002721098A|nr:DUF3089 domain-containing protein [Phenylobacterium sp.]MDO8902033.1 DUF3089 domain-containing protein [Phenylobacterium sp.]
MSRKMFAVLTATTGALALAAGVWQAQAQDAALAKNDYADKSSWLCWPGRDDACAGDNTATVIAASGAMTTETWAVNPSAPIDCFYVYPTVSNDPGVVSDMIANDEERRVVEQQLSRLGAQCRVYAPLYRQFTLTALRALVTGGALPAGGPRPNTGYLDVVDAWNHYLAHENDGRGVVLIGHSQGAGVLTQLIANEIDGKPVQDKLVSAFLIGTNLPVEKGGKTGTFKSIPLCEATDQTGCAVAYVSFRAEAPPPANSRFGVAPPQAQTMEAACVNPAALAGGKATLHAYLASSGNLLGSSEEPQPWVKDGAAVTTPFVSVPGLLSGECVRQDGFHYLAVTVNADPADPRTDTISGDVVQDGVIAQDWGLHLIDVNLAMGDILGLVESQGAAWLASRQN